MAIKGIYMMGEFRKYTSAFVYFDRCKPFEVDNQIGEVKSKVFRFFGKNVWFNKWHFLEGHKLSDLNKDQELRNLCNDIWRIWCREHNRKYKAVFAPLGKEGDLRAM